jgi:hypothetical protein
MSRQLHELKVWSDYYSALVTGVKTFEVRHNDRNFQVDDRLTLREWNPKTETYTGRWMRVTVTYILSLGDDVVVMAIKRDTEDGL